MSAIVLELWRYPVKSLLGERVKEIEVESRGLRGDRQFAVTDRGGKIGGGKTTRRFRLLPALFDMQARANGQQVLIALPDGRELEVGDPCLDQFLSKRYGDDLRIVEESSVSHHDAAPLHLLTTASLNWLRARLAGSQVDRRRFRANILLETATSGLVEDRWIGHRFELGSTLLQIRERTERCVMTTNRQEELAHDPDILAAITKLNDLCLGVYATVEQPGTIRVGDELTMVD